MVQFSFLIFYALFRLECNAILREKSVVLNAMGD